VASSLGCTDASYNLGKMYESGCSDVKGVIVNRDVDAAVRYYTEAADKGCIKSQLRLASILTSYPPPIEDYSKAMKYLLMASKESVDPNSEKITADAQNLVGEILELGYDETDPDPASALVWYTKAMQRGNARATFNLAVLYEEGLGVEKDLQKSFRLYVEADKRGSDEARHRL
jgi:TPR repeat protein